MSASADLISTLEFNKSLPERRFLLATKDEKTDLAFVYSEIISFLVKNKYSLIIINFAQSVDHYHHLLSRNGLLLKSLLSQNRAFAFDVLKSFQELATSSGDISDKFLKSYLTHPLSGMVVLFESIVKAVKDSSSNFQASGFVLFIDEINPLLNCGTPKSDFNEFIQHCRSLCFSEDLPPGFLLLGGQIEPADQEMQHYFKYLSHLADIRLSLEGLSTGVSKDIHGKMLITLNNDDHCFKKSQNLLFRVEEKHAKLYVYDSVCTA